MMLNIWQMLLLIGCGVIVALLSILMGAWLVFKSKMAVPGETFFGGIPKGEVYSIPDALESAESPEEENVVQKNILTRTQKFLKTLGGE